MQKCGMPLFFLHVDTYISAGPHAFPTCLGAECFLEIGALMCNKCASAVLPRTLAAHNECMFLERQALALQARLLKCERVQTMQHSSCPCLKSIGTCCPSKRGLQGRVHMQRACVDTAHLHLQAGKWVTRTRHHLSVVVRNTDTRCSKCMRPWSHSGSVLDKQATFP